MWCGECRGRGEAEDADAGGEGVRGREGGSGDGGVYDIVGWAGVYGRDDVWNVSAVHRSNISPIFNALGVYRNIRDALVEKIWEGISYKLDALSNAHFTPKAVR